MSKKYEVTQYFNIGHSSQLTKGLFIVHFVAAVSCFLNGLSVQYQVILLCFVVISLLIYLNRFQKNICLRYLPFSGWEIACLDNQFLPIQVLPSTVLTPYLIVFHYRPQKHRKQTILICKDALENDEYRKLMIELKVSGVNKEGE